MAGRFSSKAGRTALGGVLAAGSLAVLWLACIAPTGRLGVTAAAGLFPIGAVLLAGRGAGLLCWAAASVLGLLILPDKGVALMYLCFMGLYPVVKSRLEQCASRPLEWVGKLACFNGACFGWCSGGYSCPPGRSGWPERCGSSTERGTWCSSCMTGACPG